MLSLNSKLIHRLFNLDADLALVLTRPLVLVSLLELIQIKDLGIDNWSKSLGVSLDSTAHFLHLDSASDEDTASGADVGQVLKETRLFLAWAGNKANDGDEATDLDTGQALLHGRGAGNLDDVVNTDASCQFLGLDAPFGSLAVVDDVVGAELLEELSLLIRTRCCDYPSASSLGELDSKDAHTAGALSEHPLTGSDLVVRSTVKSVPGGETGAGEGSGLDKVEVTGHGDKTLLVKGTDASESSVNGTSKASLYAQVIEGASDVTLVEEGNDLVAGLEAGDVLANGENGTSTIGAGDHVGDLRERVFAQRDDEIAVLGRALVGCPRVLRVAR